MDKQIVLELKVEGISKEAEALAKVETRLQELAVKKREYLNLVKKEGELSNQQQLEFAAVNQEIKEQQMLRTQLNKSLTQSINLEKAEAGSINALRARNAELRKEMNSLNLTTEQGRQKLASLKAEYDKNNKSVRDFDRSLSGSNTLVGEYSRGINGAMGKLGGLAMSFIGVQQALGFVQDIIRTRAEFEKLEVVLANTLGSAAIAENSLAMIQKFAAETPFSVLELTDAYVKLANRGLVATEEQLAKMGDVASVTGKSFDQLTEAILDVSNSERWREFGIKSEKVGNKVKLTFKNVTQEVDNTVDGVMKAIEAFGGMEGVMGANEKIANSMGGSISNLGDSWSRFLDTLGKTMDSSLGNVFKWLGDNLNGISEQLSKLTELSDKGMGSYWRGVQANYEMMEDMGIPLLGAPKKAISDKAYEEGSDQRTSSGYSLTAGNKKLVKAQGELLASKKSLEALNAKIAKQNEERIKKEEKDEKASYKKRVEEYKKAEEEKKKAEEEKKKASEELKSYVETVNASLIKDEETRKKAELDLWYEQEKAKIEASKASEREQTNAKAALMRDYNNKLGAINKEFDDKEKAAKVAKAEEAINDYELALQRHQEFLDEEAKIQAEADRKELDNERKKQDAINQLKQSTIDLGMQAMDAYSSYLNAQMDEELKRADGNEKKQEKIRKKYAEKQQKVAITKAIIYAALGVANIWSEWAALPIVAAILTAIELAATGIQIATIKNQKFATGGVVQTGSELPSSTPEGDNTLVLVKPGEVILNEDQQARAGGANFFKRLGVPGFATGGIVSNIVSPAPANANLGYTAIADMVSSQIKSLKVVLNVNELNDAQDELSVINETSLV
jgi:hypothetical protein